MGPHSALLALLANVHRDPKKTKAFTPNDFNPLASANGRESRTRRLD